MTVPSEGAVASGAGAGRRAWLAVSVLAALTVLWALVEFDAYLRLVTGYAAKTAATAVFVVGRDIEAVRQRELAVASWVDLEMGEDRVEASLLWVSREARYRPGLGATLLAEPKRGLVAVTPPEPATTPLPPLPRAIDELLQRRVDEIFAVEAEGWAHSRAILVMQDGRLLAERYAPGFDQDSPLPGWSMAKSVIGALVGIAWGEGLLSIDGPAPIPEWAGKGDGRSRIRGRELLWMTSGLGFEEIYDDPRADAARMLFASADAAAVAADCELREPIGSRFVYSSGSSNLLARIFCDSLGGSEPALQYAAERLFEPVGMRPAIFELDQVGRPVASSHFLTSPQGWLRFGWMMLDDGRVGERRVLPERWMRFATRPAEASNGRFGAHLWLNRASALGRRNWPSCPGDSFAARGHNGQLLFVVPSRQAVILRLAWDAEGQAFDVDGFVAGLLAALPD